MPITAEVNVSNLFFTDDVLNMFDSNYKVKPPFRGITDRDVLKEALLDGTIDCVVTDHSPEDSESKDVEFEYAAAGMIGLETAYSVLNTSFDGTIEPEQISKVFSINPRSVIGADIPTITAGTIANFTLFNPTAEVVYQVSDLKSKSRNTPFLNRTLKGKVMMTINKTILSDNF